MPFFIYDSSMLLLIPAFVLAVWAQFRVRSTYRKYMSIGSSRGITGAQAAKYILIELAEAMSNTIQHFLARDKGIGVSGYVDAIF